MSITGYYDGAVIQVDQPLQVNQKVIIIPIENETDWDETAEGGLNQYSNISLIDKEKEAWRKAAIEKYAGK